MITRTTDTVDFDGGDTGDSEALSLLVMSVDAFAALPLPSEGVVVIGRSTKCEVQLEDGLASRQHARLHLDGALAVEDLQSANGTRVRDVTIQPNTRVPLAVGETIGIGSTLLVVQRGVRDISGQRLWSHAFFEGRVRDECVRAMGRGGRFALVRLHLERPAAWSRVVPLLARDLPRPHIFAAYGPNEFELLLVDSAPDEVTRLLEVVRTSLRNIDVPVRVGVAWYPREGRSADALFERANHLLRPADEGRIAPVGEPVSAAMKRANEQAARAATSSINVMLLGETGVGKEVMAQMVHRLSPRKGKPFVALNCAGLTESLIESELFGHEKGAFTGATQAKRGLLEAAAGGTVFLDEIGEMPISIQARLLRTIEAREVRPVGGLETRPIDVRFVSATNRDLEGEVAKGTFRRDLYFRLNTMTVTIPPLRERPSEIVPLAQTFLTAAVQDARRWPAPVFGPGVVEALEKYDWPGNVRELKNAVERALVLCEGHTIEVEHLPDRIRQPARQATPPMGSPTIRLDDLGADGRPLSAEDAAEKKRMVIALEMFAWNQSRAAEHLGIPRRTFIAKMVRYGIPRPNRKSVKGEAKDPDETDE